MSEVVEDFFPEAHYAILSGPNFASEVMRNTVSFSWKSVEGVSGYHLYRDGELILKTTEFSYIDIGNIRRDISGPPL